MEPTMRSRVRVFFVSSLVLQIEAQQAAKLGSLARQFDGTIHGPAYGTLAQEMRASFDAHAQRMADRRIVMA
jgi:hypothetical protein